MNDYFSSANSQSDPETIESLKRIAMLLEQDDYKSKPKVNNKPDINDINSPSYLQDFVTQLEKKNIEKEKAVRWADQKSNSQKIDDRNDIDLDVKNIIRSCLQIEDEAALIKSKYSKEPKNIKNDLFNPSFLNQPAPKTIQPQKSMTIKQQPKVLKELLAHPENNEEKAEDMMVAFELLNQYKKNPNFIQKELETQKKYSDFLQIEEDKEQKKNPSVKQGQAFNPLLTQEERHREIQEKREKRKKDQKLKQLEEQKQKLYAKDKDMKTLNKKPSLHNMNSDLRNVLDFTPSEHQIDADKKLDQVRQARQQIDIQTKEYEEDVKKLQQDIKKYKQEFQDQERAKREYQQQQDLKKKLEEERQLIEKEVEMSRKQMQNFKLNKLIVILNSTVMKQSRTFKNHAFSKMNQLMMFLRLREQKLQKHTSFNRKQKFLRAWMKLYRQIQNQRELERYEKEQELMKIQEKKANNLRVNILKRKSLKALAKNLTIRKQEKIVEQEHSQMKNQIDSFFSQLKQKVEQEEVKQKKEKNDKEEKDKIKSKLRDNKIYQKEEYDSPINQAHQSSLQEEFKSPTTIKSPNFDSQIEEIKEEIGQSESKQQYSVSNISQFESKQQESTQIFNISISQSQLNQLQNIQQSQQSNVTQTSNQNQSQTSNNQQQPSKQTSKLSAIPERPKQVLEMELRAKERKDKREMLNKQYEEKKKKAEEEKKLLEVKKEEEKKKKLHEEREEKRKVKLEEMKKQEELKKETDLIKMKMDNAKLYYDRGLLIKFGIIPLTENVVMEKRKKILADNLRKKQILRFGLNLLKEGIQGQLLENEEKEYKQMRIASRFEEMKVYRKIFIILKKEYYESLKQADKLYRKHDQFMLKFAILRWQQGLEILRQERLTLEQKQDKIVYKFRLLQMGRKIFRMLRQNALEEKIENEKKTFKDQMWNKVNKWLGDLDSKTTTATDQGFPTFSPQQILNQLEQENSNRYGNHQTQQ